MSDAEQEKKRLEEVQRMEEERERTKFEKKRQALRSQQEEVVGWQELAARQRAEMASQYEVARAGRNEEAKASAETTKLEQQAVAERLVMLKSKTAMLSSGSATAAVSQPAKGPVKDEADAPV